MVNKQRLVGQFLQGEFKKVKTDKRHISAYSNSVSSYGLYKVNGMTFKAGVVGNDYRH